MASAFLTLTLHDSSIDSSAYMAKVEEAVTKCLSINASCWQAYANKGALHLFRHDWDIANIEFAEAKRLSPLSIGVIGGYGIYLLANRRDDEARNLAQQYRDGGFDDDVLLVRAGLYLYCLADYSEAKQALHEAIELNDFWRAHLVLVFVHLALNEPAKALVHLDRTQAGAHAEVWPGLRIVCLEAAGEIRAAEAEFEKLLELSQRTYVQPIQLALGYMALNHYPEAISCLERACDDSDPFTAWLHLWPVLDPLRRIVEFRELLHRLKFPKLAAG